MPRVHHSYRGLIRATQLCPFETERPSSLAPSDRGEEKGVKEKYRRPMLVGKGWLDHPHPSSDASPAEFQTQPELVIFPQPQPPIRIPCLASRSHRPLPLLSSLGCVARSRPSGHEECSFSPFGTDRKGLDTHARDLGSRCWHRCPLRTCTSWNLLITLRSFNNALLGSRLCSSFL